jgi:small subunit ribosomal protein S17
MAKKTAIGVVTSDRTAKTRRVEIPRLVRHPKYGKFLRRRTICYAHDEDGQSHAGDTVEIEECRPMSRLKRWKLVRVVTKAGLVGAGARRGATAAEEQGLVEGGPS